MGMEEESLRCREGREGLHLSEIVVVGEENLHVSPGNVSSAPPLSHHIPVEGEKRESTHAATMIRAKTGKGTKVIMKTVWLLHEPLLR